MGHVKEGFKDDLLFCSYQTEPMKVFRPKETFSSAYRVSNSETEPIKVWSYQTEPTKPEVKEYLLFCSCKNETMKVLKSEDTFLSAHIKKSPWQFWGQRRPSPSAPWILLQVGLNSILSGLEQVYVSPPELSIASSGWPLLGPKLEVVICSPGIHHLQSFNCWHFASLAFLSL